MLTIAISHQAHQIPCSCDGRDGLLPCVDCHGRGYSTGDTGPDCGCDRCGAGPWFVPSDGELAEQYSDMHAALVGSRHRAGEIVSEGEVVGVNLTRAVSQPETRGHRGSAE